MSNRRWVNNTQPQTLQIAVILLYANAIFLALFGYLTAAFPFGLILVVGQGLGAFGVANERRWGYVLSVAMAVLPFLLIFSVGSLIMGGYLLGIMLQVALLALLLHPQSRAYQRIWFK